MKLYAVRKMKVKDKKAEKINQRMNFVMTGDLRYIERKIHENITKVNKKKKNMKW